MQTAYVQEVDEEVQRIMVGLLIPANDSGYELSRVCTPSETCHTSCSYTLLIFSILLGLSTSGGKYSKSAIETQSQVRLHA